MSSGCSSINFLIRADSIKQIPPKLYYKCLSASVNLNKTSITNERPHKDWNLQIDMFQRAMFYLGFTNRGNFTPSLIAAQLGICIVASLLWTCSRILPWEDRSIKHDLLVIVRQSEVHVGRKTGVSFGLITTTVMTPLVRVSLRFSFLPSHYAR